MSRQINRSEEEIHDVASWAEVNVIRDETEHEEGTYEQGVLDAIRWLLGVHDSRPDGL
ncbi:hypothetical protein [Neptuniibacter sp.]|uniref:hypothetical protein n=1 Tax=Neptuniibacter sp. TaxID=1962643 RepID=UPI003B5C370A